MPVVGGLNIQAVFTGANAGLFPCHPAHFLCVSRRKSFGTMGGFRVFERLRARSLSAAKQSTSTCQGSTDLVDNDIEQGMPRCDKCFEVLPCHDHPAPPKLSIVHGGCNIPGCVLCESPSHKPDTVTIKTTDGTIECEKRVTEIVLGSFDFGDVLPVPDDDCIFPLEQNVHTDWPNLDCHFPDCDSDGTNFVEEKNKLPPPPDMTKEQNVVVNFPGATLLDIKPELVVEEALKRKPSLLVVIGYDENGDEFFLWSSADSHTNNFILDRAKMSLMAAYDAED